MKYHEAAVEVLRQSGRPMTDAEITDRALELGLITTTGKTPRQTMSAALYVRSKDPSALVQRLAEQGATRAKRGSVRWTLRNPA